MKTGKFASAVRSKDTLKVKPSTKIDFKKTPFSKTAAVLKSSKSAPKGMPTKMAIHKFSKLGVNIVQKMAKRTPIKTMKMAKEMSGMKRVSSGKGTPLAVQSFGKKNTGKKVGK